MKVIKILGLVLALAFGIFMVVYGEGDDSPGAQMLGLIFVVGGLYGLVKMRKKKPD